MSMSCPKCKEPDQEGEEVRDFSLAYECANCGYQWDSSEEPLSNAYEQAKNLRKYGGL